MEFRVEIKAWRDRLNLTQAQAAEMLGLSQRTLAGYERINGPSPKPDGPIKKLMQIAECTGNAYENNLKGSD